MTDLQLADRSNWELILTQSRIVTRSTTKELSYSLYEYEPIQPIYANPKSHLLLIGTKSETAKPHWYLGARALQYLYVSPSTSGNFTSGVQAGSSINVGLNKMTLVKFEDYDTFDYVLELQIPYWIEDIYVEVFEYKGFIEPDSRQILDRLDSIETKIDSIENFGS